MSPERVFRWLIRLLPVEFRADHDRDMEQVFREQHKDARGEGRTGLARMWWRTALDVLRTAPRQHLDHLRQDAAHALRGLRRYPGFALVAVLTLALGIGANTAMFSLAWAVLLRPLPYPEPERLVQVWNRWMGSPQATLSGPEYLDYEERLGGLRLGAMTTRAVNVLAGDEPVRVSGAYVTAGLVDVLGVQPALGRDFTPEEETRGRDRVAVLTHSLWARRFGARDDAIGQTVTVDGVPREIVGVMPQGFLLPTDFSGESAQVLLPLTLDRGASRAKRGGHYLVAVARLGPGVPLEQARAEADRLIAQLARDHPDEHDQGGFGIAIVPLRTGLLGPAQPVVRILLAAVALVLLMACANVASLLLARGEARRRELAVRAALGATRLRLVRQVLTETCVLSLVSALAGVPLALAILKGVLVLDPRSLPRVGEATLDVPVLVFTTAIAVGAGVLFGLVPALQMSRVGVGEVLGEAPRGAIGGRRRVRRALVTLQVATAVVLLVGAGLLVKSFARLLSIPTGVTAADVLTLRVTAPESSYPGRPEVTAFFARLLDDIRALPGVRVVGAANGLPLSVPSGDWDFDVEGRPSVPGKRPAADWFAVTPGYFDALGVPLKRGRLPSASDAENAPPVLFFNETAARLVFPGQDPVGRRIRLSRSAGHEQPWRTVAGVVADVRHRRRDLPPRPEMYVPHPQFLHFSPGAQARTMSVVIRTSRPPLALVEEARAALRAVDPQVPASQVRTMEDVLDASVAARRRDVWLMGAFAGIALLLAAIGVYGVTAWDASQRVREFGVRMALGATPADVRRLVLLQGLRPVDAGLVAGIGAAALLAGALRSMLFEVNPRDLTVFAAIAFLLLLVGAVACLLPALRATRLGPARALREE